MNFVFWLIVILLMALVWFKLSDSFWDIGDYFSGLVNDAKEGMEADYDSEEVEEEINEKKGRMR